MNVFILHILNETRSEKPGHKSEKFPFYDIVDLYACFYVDPRKSHSKIPRTHHFTAFWYWHSWSFSKLKVFVFHNFFEILFKKSFSFYGAVGRFLTCFSADSWKPHLNTQNSPLYSISKLRFLGIFKNESFRFFQFSRNFVFRLMTQFFRLRQQWIFINCWGNAVFIFVYE